MSTISIGGFAKQLKEEAVNGLTVTNSVLKQNKKTNKNAEKEVVKKIDDFQKAVKLDKDVDSRNKFNYNSDKEKEYHDEMEIMNGQEMIEYDREPNELFKERAKEGVTGSSRMGNENTNEDDLWNSSDKDFGKKRVKQASDSFKKRMDANKGLISFGDDIEVVEKGKYPMTKFSSLNEGVDYDVLKYTHYGVDKETGKIVTGWDYAGVDDEDIKYYSKLDFQDMFPEKRPSDFKIITKRALEKQVDISNTDNWFTGVSENKTINENNEEFIHIEELTQIPLKTEKYGTLVSSGDVHINRGGNLVTYKLYMNKDKVLIIPTRENNVEKPYFMDVNGDNQSVRTAKSVILPDSQKNLERIIELLNKPIINENKKYKMKRLKFNKEFNGVGNALKLIPESVKIDNNVFEMTDGNENYKIRWEGTLNEGKAVVLMASDSKMVNEDMNKMKKLMGYNSSEIYTKSTGKERLTENEMFFDLVNKVRIDESDEIEGQDAPEVDPDDQDQTQAPEAKEEIIDTVPNETEMEDVPNVPVVKPEAEKQTQAPEAKEHIMESVTLGGKTFEPIKLMFN